MKIIRKGSGQKKEKVSRRVATAANEFGERAGKHFSERFVNRLPNVHGVRLWVVEWAILILVVFLLAIAQNVWYGESFETEAFVKGGDYSEATLGKINSMNPLYAATSSERVLARLLFANLVAPDSTGHLRNELVDTVTPDEEKKVWTLKLRDNLYWSDGERITADDVLYTIGLIVDTTAKTTIVVDYANVKLEKKDDLTVVFTLPSSYTDFRDTLEFPLVPEHILGEIKPALVYESSFSTRPVGSGPFALNALQAANTANAVGASMQTVYLSRNPRYFKKETKLDSFTIKTYENTTQIKEAMRNADVMATAELTRSEADELPGTIRRNNTLINGGAFAFLNTTSEKLKDAKIRQAILRGVDMSKVREGIDEAQILDYPILQRQEELKTPNRVEYDLKSAQDLIKSAGLKYEEDKIINKSGEQVTINISVPKRDVLTGVAERFSEGLKQLGFEVAMNIYDEAKAPADFFSAIVQTRDYDILIYEVDLGVSADPFVYYSSSQVDGVGWNFSNYKNSLVDDALITARTTTNAKLRKTKLESFLKYWVQDVPAIGLYQSTMNYSHSANVQVYSENSELTDALDRFSEVQNWASRKAHVNMTP